MKKINLLILAVVPIILSAQEQLKQGFIVKATHDTLHGYLKPVTESQLDKQIFFTQQVNGQLLRFTTADLIAFGFAGENRFGRIRYTHPYTLVSDERFAKLLTEGYYELYAFTEQDRRYYAVNTYEDSTYLLFDDKFSGVSGTVDEAGNYRNQLLFLSVPCEEMKNEVENIEYSQAALSKYVDKLNRCISPSENNAIVYTKDKSYLHIYAYAGGITFGNKYQMAGKIIGHITIPTINKNTSVNVGLSMLANKKIVTILSHFNSSLKTHETEYNTVLSIPLTIQYDFLPGKIKPYVEAGLSLAYIESRSTEDYLSYKHHDKKVGLGVIGAIGIEGFITKRLMIKAHWHYELLLHYPTIGIGYFFK